MSIKRSLSKTIIGDLQNQNNTFISLVSADIQNQKVFLAIRNGYVDLYHNGGRLFKFDKNGFQTHIKYASVLSKTSKDYLNETELANYSLATNFHSNYDRIKENCTNYAGIEANGVSNLYHKYSYLSNNDIIVLDIEVSFKSNDVNKKQDRIDIVLYNKATKTLRFVEAKHYSNKEIRSTKKPAVVSQIQKYKNQIYTNEKSIISAYTDYIDSINLLYNLALPYPKSVDNDVTLLIFGFDNDQKQVGLKTIEKQLSGIMYYSVGNIKNVKISSLWNQAKVL